MSVNENSKEQLELISGVLIKAFAAGLIILVVWVIFSIFGAEAAFKIHEEMFGIAAEKLMVINYAGMGLFKLFLFSFFLLPYIGIRWKIKCKCHS